VLYFIHLKNYIFIQTGRCVLRKGVLDMEKEICDLHIHSSNSDGVLNVEDIILKAKFKGLRALSITDHDTISGQVEALEVGRRHGIEVLSGIEFSVEEDGKRIHILGYLVDPGNDELVEAVERLRRFRHERAERIVEKLNEAGVPLELKDVEVGEKEQAIGRPHIAMALLKQGMVKSYNEAFNRYLADGACCYVPKRVYPSEKVVELIAAAGGVAVWAHPGWEAFNESLLDGLISLGIKGIEVWHPNHSRELEANLLSLAEEKNLIPTGGSDYHRDEAMQFEIGGKGAPYSSVIKLRETAARR